MWGNLLLIMTLVLACNTTYPLEAETMIQDDVSSTIVQKTIPPTPILEALTAPENPSSQRLATWLYQRGFDLNPQVIDVLERIINYANNNQIVHNQILTLIDYSIPANKKRLWVFDLEKQKVLFHTYVSHGIKSGALNTYYFSNRFNSKASSIGVYLTNKAYYGRHGLSLRLDGLDRGFNDNAESRAIVMHGGWYMEEDFINKYGCSGRSWGCPAVPDDLSTPIIKTIKDQSLLVIYYPSAAWFQKSKFLQRDPSTFLIHSDPPTTVTTASKKSIAIEDVLFAQLQKKNKYHQHEAILVMPVERYTTVFHTRAPLKRMLRKQIKDEEYIALTKTELDQIISSPAQTTELLQDLYFVVPQVKMVRGYYATEMNKLDLGKITAIQPSTNTSNYGGYYIVNFDDQASLKIKTTHRFIRWLGL